MNDIFFIFNGMNRIKNIKNKSYCWSPWAWTRSASNLLFFVLDVCEFITKSLDFILGSWIVISRFWKIDSLPEWKISLIHSHHSIEMSIVNLMVRSRNMIFVLGHLLRIHFKPSISRVLIFVASSHLSN